VFGSAKSEHLKVTNGEYVGRIPTYVITIPQRHIQTDSDFAVAIGLPRSA